MPAVVQRRTVRQWVSTSRGVKEVEATPVGSGLFVVHRAVEGKGWVITHAKTGWAICLVCLIPTQSKAVVIARAIEQKYGPHFQSNSVATIQASGISSKEMMGFIVGLLK